jgi:predicted nucleic acid-binding protein
VIVVDASCVVTFVVRGRGADAVAARMVEDELGAPHLLDVEVVSALRRLVSRKLLSERRADEALTALSDLRVMRYPHTRLLDRLWQLRNTLTPYDAAYVALAETLDARLVTADARLARSTGHRARIELVAA